ncbi:MAG: RNA polymerase sigma factor [Clostridiales bacterium]|nr:RNA polymerase sigma factor [Clostridiales bacterium]
MTHAMTAAGETAPLDFDTLFETYQTEALRAAYLICGNRADAEDAVQEAFVQCYRHLDALRDPEKAKAWLFRILTRTAWRVSGKSRRETPVDDLYAGCEPADEDAEAPILRADRAAQLRRALARLEVKQRTAVVLYYYNGLSVRQTARAMGCLEGTVKSRLYHAREKLRTILEVDFDEI